MTLFETLKKPKYLFAFLGSAILIFDFNYYLMSTLPGTRDEMCVMGVNLNAGNIVFSIALSILMGVMIAGLISLFACKAAQRKMAMASLSGLGAGIGLFTFFCPICAIPLLSISGISIVAQAFNDFNLEFKIVSLVLLGVSLFLLDKHLSIEGGGCAFERVKKR